MEFFASLKQQIIFTCDIIIESENVAQARALIDRINQFFIDIQKPKIFRSGDPENAIIALELSYEELCALLENNGASNPKMLSLFEFYSRISYLKKTGPKMRE